MEWPPTSSEANPPTGGGAGPGAVPRCDGHARRRHWSVDHFAIGNGPASRLATNLRELGEYQQARVLDEETFVRSDDAEVREIRPGNAAST